MNHVTTLRPVTSAADLETASRIYHESFPEEERRPWQQIVAPAIAGEPELLGIYDDDDIIAGLITFWWLGPELYIEHFAIEPSRRGAGLGSRVVECIRTVAGTRPVVLEVEPAALSDEAARHVAFYRRHGFELLDYPYLQPPYLDGLPGVSMSLMSTSPTTDPADLADRLHRRVYRQD